MGSIQTGVKGWEGVGHKMAGGVGAAKENPPPPHGTSPHSPVRKQSMVDAPIVSAQGGLDKKKRRYLSLNLDSIRSSFWFSFR